MTRWTDGAPTAARRRRLLLLLAAGVLALATAAVLLRPGDDPAHRAATTTATSSPRPTPSDSAPRSTTASPRTPAPSQPDPAHEAELRQVAAGLPAVQLTSPTLWDRWLPQGKPYPGADLQDDLSTCPVLSDRLEAVTGQQMSYWTGTLPAGPFGCTWVETPLSGQDNDYDHVIGVGFLADGSTVEDVRRYREGPGQGTHACPSVDVPSVAAGALLSRCADDALTTYTLAVPDARLEGGVWFLTASSKDRTAVRPAAVLPVLLDGVVAAFG